MEVDEMETEVVVPCASNHANRKGELVMGNMEKKIDLTPFLWCEEKRELMERNKRAEEYSARAELRRAKRKERKAEICVKVLGVVAGILLGSVLLYVVNKVDLPELNLNLPKFTLTHEDRYAIPSETTSKGMHYIYVTERYCTVTEVTQDYITVDYNGNEYSFFGYGYEVGEEIICQFTDNWEIVGVTERS